MQYLIWLKAEANLAEDFIHSFIPDVFMAPLQVHYH